MTKSCRFRLVEIFLLIVDKSVSAIRDVPVARTNGDQRNRGKKEQKSFLLNPVGTPNCSYRVSKSSIRPAVITVLTASNLQILFQNKQKFVAFCKFSLPETCPASITHVLHHLWELHWFVRFHRAAFVTGKKGDTGDPQNRLAQTTGGPYDRLAHANNMVPNPPDPFYCLMFDKIDFAEIPDVWECYTKTRIVLANRQTVIDTSFKIIISKAFLMQIFDLVIFFSHCWSFRERLDSLLSSFNRTKLLSPRNAHVAPVSGAYHPLTYEELWGVIDVRCTPWIRSCSVG